ncbi:MAG TPA: histidine--tRNA ligase [Nitrospirota bacterium]|nr:histidine--tRNA ligase [Nitrospirota bacterium]
MLTQAIKGVKDMLPADARKWQRLEAAVRELFSDYGFSEIRTPIIEHTILFARSIGATSDIVEKEMYAFRDQGGDEITLRPEGTAGVVRAYVEHKLYAASPVLKLFYMGPMFRRERPQAGRLRQFHQVGVEALGAAEPGMDVDVLAVLDALFKKLGVTGVELQVNSLGCRDCRPKYRGALTDFLMARKEQLCPDCQRRIEANPLRALDCKSEHCKAATAGAPAMADYLDEACREHFADLRRGIEDLGIKYSVNPRMVRGLDYYTRTAFEMVATDKKGAQNAVAAGGRYDGLVEELGGPPTPGIGFALGVERLLLMLPEDGSSIEPPKIFIAALGDEAGRLAQKLTDNLRRDGIPAERDYSGASLKSQMKKADRSGARHVLIIGGDELAKGVAILRDMATKEQAELPMEDIVNKIKGR